MAITEMSLPIDIPWKRMDRSGSGPLCKFFPYAVAIISVGGAAVTTLGIGSVIKYVPTLFFCSVILSSWFGGVCPGIFAGLLSAIALDYYFIPPIYALGISPDELPDMIAFLASAFFVSWLSGERKRAKNLLREAQDKLETKIREASPTLGRTEDQSQIGPAEHSPNQAHAEVSRVARTRRSDEFVDPTTSEPRERTVQPEEVVDAQTPALEKTDGKSADDARESVTHPPTLRSQERPILFKQGDYWTIQYQGRIAHIKSTRGLYCLASLLGHPGQEFHVSELNAAVARMPMTFATGVATREAQEWAGVWTARFRDAGPILDSRAKAEYNQRLAELREELEDAERLNDPERATKIQQERDCIADQLATAVGLGGRNRKAASDAERARSAVTKRIRDSIDKIGAAIPPLGRHLAVTIKTGYFCCYNPNPDCPVG